MTSQASPSAPKGLSGPGRRLWRTVASAYVLRPDELVLLESACRTADYLTQLDEALVGAPLTVKGSMGQEREHPLLSERRQQSGHLARLLTQLKLPDQGDTTAADQRSVAARRAARARWGSAALGGGA